MIAGEPYLVDHEGDRVLVDANGDELVCRRQSPYTHGCYHRVDLDQFACNDVVKPRCIHVTGYDDNWTLRRHAALNQTWDGCRYGRCYGDDETTVTENTGPQLAAALRDMSVTEFEAAVSNHRSVQADGGERV